MNSGAPYFYDYINAETSQVTPSTIHVRNTALSAFFRRYLFQKAMSVFKWNLPETGKKIISSILFMASAIMLLYILINLGSYLNSADLGVIVFNISPHLLQSPILILQE